MADPERGGVRTSDLKIQKAKEKSLRQFCFYIKYIYVNDLLSRAFEFLIFTAVSKQSHEHC